MDDELLPLLPGVLETAIAPERSGRRQSHTTKTVIKTLPRKRTIPKKAGPPRSSGSNKETSERSTIIFKKPGLAVVKSFLPKGGRHVWSPLSMPKPSSAEIHSGKAAHSHVEALVEDPQVHVPPFFKASHGTSVHWKTHRWHHFWLRDFRPVDGAVVDPDRVMAFFRMRPGPDGKPVSELLGNPEGPYEGNVWPVMDTEPGERSPMEAYLSWFRCQWLGGGCTAKFETAWRSAKFETLYSTMYHRKLLPSCEVHSAPFEKSICFTPLCEDGVFWAAKWEVLVDKREANSDISAHFGCAV